MEFTRVEKLLLLAACASGLSEAIRDPYIASPSKEEKERISKMVTHLQSFKEDDEANREVVSIYGSFLDLYDKIRKEMESVEREE